jgi:RNase adaptor protein for sRNA GlmZ degradation
MYVKIVNVKFKKMLVPVFAYVDGENDDNDVVVSVRCMVNEYFLEEQIKFKARDNAYDFIKHYSPAMASAFVVREAYDAGAVD